MYIIMFNCWMKLLILSYCNITRVSTISHKACNNFNYKLYSNIINILFCNKKKINKNQIKYINCINKYLNLINFFFKYKFIKTPIQLYRKLLNINLYLTNKQLRIICKKTNNQYAHNINNIYNYNFLNHKFNNSLIRVNKVYYINTKFNKIKNIYTPIYPTKNRFIFKLDKIILNLYYKKKKFIHKRIINKPHKINITYIKFIISTKNTHIYKLFKYNNIIIFYSNVMLNNFFFKYKKKKKINKYITTRKYFSYKIKLKPGFSTLWRLFRQKCKNLYDLKFKFQHSLTKYINIVSSIRVYYKLLYWFSNLNKIFTIKFIKLNMNLYIYINGIKLIYTSHLKNYFYNKKKLNLTYLCIGDCLQLPYSYKFLLYYKNIYIFNTLMFTQYDISSLGVFYLYHNTLLINWGYNRKYSHNLFNFKIYNWKYIT